MNNTFDINKISSLAKLRLTHEEKKVYEPQLEKVLGMFDSLLELDVSGVDFLHLAEKNRLAEDIAQPSLTPDAALSGSKNVKNDGFGVPTVLGKAT